MQYSLVDNRTNLSTLFNSKTVIIPNLPTNSTVANQIAYTGPLLENLCNLVTIPVNNITAGTFSIFWSSKSDDYSGTLTLNISNNPNYKDESIVIPYSIPAVNKFTYTWSEIIANGIG
jgi:hypothetical protein